MFKDIFQCLDPSHIIFLRIVKHLVKEGRVLEWFAGFCLNNPKDFGDSCFAPKVQASGGGALAGVADERGKHFEGREVKMCWFFGLLKKGLNQEKLRF